MGESERWRAVLSHETGTDHFVYAVRTTGVYCRASCPSRRPRRENVTFFDDARSARAAGYRACRRCAPDSELGDERTERVILACRQQLLAGGHLGTETLASRLGVSSRQLARDVRAVLDLSPSGLANAVRAQHAREVLQRSATVTAAVFDSGFSSSRRFYETITPTLGMAPRQFHDGGRGVTVFYNVVPTVLGPTLVAATPVGLTLVQLGVEEEDAQEVLLGEYPRAALVATERELHAANAAVASLAHGTPSGHDLPFDVAASAFTGRVWAALRRIPSGQTRSYAQVAAEVAAPRGARAVARACATNPVALVIPCHRVVRSDGGLGGYRWGIEVKRALLEAEAASTDSLDA